MINIKVLGFFLLFSLTLTIQINSHLSPASSQVSINALQSLNLLKPQILQGKLSTIELKNLEAVLSESLNLVKKSIKQKAETVVEDGKQKPIKKTQTKPLVKKELPIPKPNFKTVTPPQKTQAKQAPKTKEVIVNPKGNSTPAKTPKTDIKAPSISRVAPSVSKVAPADIKTHKDDNKKKLDSRVVYPPHIKDHPKKINNEDDSSEESSAIDQGLNQNRPSATPKKQTKN